MKKRILIPAIFGVIVVIASIIAFAHHAASDKTQTGDHSDKQSTASASSSSHATPGSNSKSKPSNTSKSSNPCAGVLSLAQATSILGARATANNSNGSTQTADMTITTCGYTNGNRSIRVVAHVAKTHSGTLSNDLVFGSERPRGVTNVSGYGDAAFWQPSTKQLNILKHNDWYIISNSANNNVHGAEQVAKLVLANT